MIVISISAYLSDLTSPLSRTKARLTNTVPAIRYKTWER